MTTFILTLLLAAADQPPSATPGPITVNGQRRVCHTIPRTGSRVSGDRICKTADEWEHDRQEAQRMVAARQNQNLEPQPVRTPASPQ